MVSVRHGNPSVRLNTSLAAQIVSSVGQVPVMTDTQAVALDKVFVRVSSEP